MPKPDNQYQAMARDAAARIERQRELGEQLTFLPDEADPSDSAAAKRGKGKALSQMREWLELRGYRLPEETLAQMAGLASSADAVLTAMETAERVLAWAWDVDPDKLPPKVSRHPSPRQRLEVFQQVYTAQLRAADALMPYGAAKASPDQVVNQNVNVIVPAGPSAPADPGAAARVVNPRPGGRMAPPPLPGEIEQNQAVARPDRGASDSEGRTE